MAINDQSLTSLSWIKNVSAANDIISCISISIAVILGFIPICDTYHYILKSPQKLKQKTKYLSILQQYFYDYSLYFHKKSTQWDDWIK